MTTYREINSTWPEPMPVPTPRQAIHGTRSLIRRAFALAAAEGVQYDYGRYIHGRKFKITSGRRRTWPRGSVWVVNPNERNRGWGEIVHSVSHWAQRRFWPKENPHAHRHVWIEAELTKHAIASLPRWNVAAAGETKPKPDVKELRAARVAASIKRWESKKKRADTALRKLRKQARYYGVK